MIMLKTKSLLQMIRLKNLNSISKKLKLMLKLKKKIDWNQLILLTKKILKIILEKLASYQDKSKRVLNLKLKRQIIEEKEMIEKGNHRKEYLELFLRLPESVIANLMMTMMRTIKSKLSKRIQKTIEKLQHLDQIMRMKKTMTTISMQLMKFQLTSY